MSKQSRNASGYVLAILGLIVAGIELGRYWLAGRPIGPIPMITAIILFFVGGAIIDTAKATAIGGFVVNGAVTIISALPFGRRATDKMAAQGATIVIPPTAPPVAPPTEAEVFPDGRGPNDHIGGIL